MWPLRACAGGKDESKVPELERLGQEVDLDKRVELLIESTCYTVFAYTAQVCTARGLMHALFISQDAGPMPVLNKVR